MQKAICKNLGFSHYYFNQTGKKKKSLISQNKPKNSCALLFPYIPQPCCSNHYHTQNKVPYLKGKLQMKNDSQSFSKNIVI